MPAAAALAAKKVVPSGKGRGPGWSQEMGLRKFLGSQPDLARVSKAFADIGGRRPSIQYITLDQYAEKHAAAFERLLRAEEDPRWAPRASMEGLEVFQFFDDDTGLTAVKGVILLNCAGKGGIKFIVEKFTDISGRPAYDESCMNPRTVERHLPQYEVVYMQIESPSAFISHRDILMLLRLRFEEDGTVLIVLLSTQHEGAPETPEFVRVHMHTGGYILQPTEKPDVYKVTYFVQADLGGYLPRFVQRALAWKQGLSLLNLKKAFDL